MYSGNVILQVQVCLYLKGRFIIFDEIATEIQNKKYNNKHPFDDEWRPIQYVSLKGARYLKKIVIPGCYAKKCCKFVGINFDQLKYLSSINADDRVNERTRTWTD